MTPIGRGAEDVSALLAEARQKLEELGKVAAEAMAQARAAMSIGRPLTKAESKALNRSAALARYVADCAYRAAWDPPKGRRKAGWASSESQALPPRWEPPMSQSHEQRAMELLREAPIGFDAVESFASHWCDDVRAWLELDSARTAEAPQPNEGHRSESKGAEVGELVRAGTDADAVVEALRERGIRVDWRRRP